MSDYLNSKDKPEEACIYFDHAATSWPKPGVIRVAFENYLQEGIGNPGRSGHRMSIAAAQLVEDTRERLARLFNISDPSRIAFTKSATEALNLAMTGLLRPGDHVVTSSVEHNSVIRPLRFLEENGVALTVVTCAPDGSLNTEAVRQALRPNTRLIVTLHGSNVLGTLLPVRDIAKIAREKDVHYLVDVSQTAGVVPIDITDWGVDMVAFTGHKGLLGVTGTGGLYIRDGLDLSPLIRGGTGSESESEIQPTFMPDCYEAGTPNVAGLAALAASVGYLLNVGVENVWEHEQQLLRRFIDGVVEIPGIQLYGRSDIEQRCGVAAFNIQGLSCSDVGLLLDQNFGIMSRVGLHCAPEAHRTIGTFPTGTVRFSFGYTNTRAEIDHALTALEKIAKWTGK